MRFFVLVIIFLFYGIKPLVAQKTAADYYEKGVTLLRDGFLNEGLPFLYKAIEKDSNMIEAYLSVAGVMGEKKIYAKAVEWYQMAKQRDSVGFTFYHLPYAINLAGLGRFSEALAAVNYFLAIPGLSERSQKSGLYRRQCFEFAVDYEKKHGKLLDFHPVNMGDSINSVYSEYFPSVGISDSLLVFTRRGKGRQGEFFFMSKLLNNVQYEKAKLIQGDLNEEPLKGAICISADGDWMIFAGELSNATHPSFDLYICYRTPDGWSEPENLGPNINSDYWESGPSLSPDNKVLYFASNRPGGYGGSDIYMSVRESNGKWGRAMNMGDKINTPGDEQAPFIHSDNQTLYFSSNGLTGYGGSDLFVVKKNALGLWDLPENLGYPINTIENEGSLAVAANGETAYYASDRADSRGELDLYTFTLPITKRPHKTLYVKGIVFDAKTLKGLPSTVKLLVNATGKPLMEVQTDETGKYFVTLPLGEDYTFSVNRKGYLFYTQSYPLSQRMADSTYAVDIALQPILLNNTLVLKSILFKYNSFELLPESKAALETVKQLLLDNPTIQIEISGHTDNVGNAEFNRNLSNNRAKAVVDYLVANGIPQKMLTFKGYGSTKPIADNNTEAGREQNRRTELKVVAVQ